MVLAVSVCGSCSVSLQNRQRESVIVILTICFHPLWPPNIILAISHGPAKSDLICFTNQVIYSYTVNAGFLEVFSPVVRGVGVFNVLLFIFSGAHLADIFHTLEHGIVIISCDLNGILW